MERPCRVVAALLLLTSFNLRLGICSYDAHQGTANDREEDVHSAARAILREALRQPSRYRSQQHFGSKQAGWRNLGAYPPPAYRSWYTGGSFQGSSFPPPPPPSSSSSPNPYRTPSQQPSFPRWPPWPWMPNLPPTTTMNFPPLQGSGSSPTGAPAPAPAPVVTKPLASPRHAEDPAHSGVASPPQPATVVTVTHGTAVVAGEASSEAKRAPRRRPLYVIAAAGASVLLAISVALSVLCYRSSKVVTVVRPWATGLSGQLQKAFVTGVPALKRTELELACEDFSNVVGSLSDYMMYKGTLSSGVEIAVISTTKSAKEWSKHCEAQFRKKITSLSRVNHKNFVNLLGYCEQEQPFTRMMVFEYAPNGTLFEHLHEREDGHLDWPTRLRVAVGVAYCLEHMHQLSPPEILRALDTSTIYLTDDFAAKIADVFFCCEEEATATTATETASQRSPVLSDRESVVYSYGMVLLEIMSGRFTASEGGLLEGWAASFLRGERRLRDVMDPGLSRNATLHGETVERLDGVIRSCTDREARRRPAMPEVARRLREITAMPPEAATPKVSPLWWAELEIISTEAT